MKRAFVLLTLASSLVGCATDRDATGRPESGSGVATGAAVQPVSAQDASFAREACQAGATEVEIGKLAARNTSDREVRALARKISEDHADADKELGKLFARKGVPPESELSPNFQRSLDHLASLTGGQFDQAFKQHVIEDYERAIASFEQQAQHGTDPDLRAFAQSHLPHLREHLTAAQRLQVDPNRRDKPEPTAADVLANPAVRIR
ncbi:MAG TPA: DUF4142 domain-containing protein [Verrucomicrobiae bacterium]|nr:DUF4142 domain-containing protein [Verrucomicrobiae bacterium]